MRSFKIQFHNGEENEKAIVTASVVVNNESRFKKLGKDGNKRLLENLDFFKHQLEAFMHEVSIDTDTPM